MRKQIAAANWKMNCTFQQGEKLLDEILGAEIPLADHQLTIFAVPFPYLLMTRSEVEEEWNYNVAAQNCHHKKSGAYTGEVSAEMLHSMNIRYCVVGHSERREYNQETNAMLADKVNLCFENFITPIFCCGEPLNIREAGTQNDFVSAQLKESLFHLGADKIKTIIIAYEPIWAIGTGKTATTEQAQEIHQYLRSVLAAQYGDVVANEIPILYGGSVKANNAKELFSCPDVDGGLVGGASLVAAEFIEIIKALK
ncbi:MAG: triose-phosphate isomerase [Chitinophagaceae bacterium]|jgi:triosephosphate isomerase|nr:triose-phosphate isomerase [Chitinophagaceae bacterium]MBL0068465.1 triose-phosphate isomerase [Chitinophagaceae bacterium]MBP6233384.1 triose-phosphate isomerase [Chitinophagaceae bacterium]MBP6415729.1 triose-phosphate isomerase [Chitinophagaceae bacterium]